MTLITLPNNGSILSWKALADDGASFVGGRLEDVNPDGGRIVTAITGVRFDGKTFTVDGVGYSCSVDVGDGLIGTEHGWILVVAMDVRWRFSR